MTAAPLADDTAIPLRDVPAHFPYFTVSTLRVEAARGRLAIYKIGNKHFTTPADIKAMIQLCRVEQKGRDFILIRGGSNGLSETDQISSAQERVKESVARLKSSSRNTSLTNINRSRRALP